MKPKKPITFGEYKTQITLAKLEIYLAKSKIAFAESRRKRESKPYMTEEGSRKANIPLISQGENKTK